MNETAQNKLSSRFQSLYREHDHAWLFIVRIKQGLYRHTDIYKLANYVRWCWKNHIRPHFLQEEQVLLPMLSKDDPIGKKLKDDHNYILELMISIDRKPDAFDLSTFANFIGSHIRWEETVFFDHLEKHLPIASLEIITEKLKEPTVQLEKEWGERFWEN